MEAPETNSNTAPDALGPDALDSALARPMSERFRRAVTSRTEQTGLLTGYDMKQSASATAHFAFAPDLLEVSAGFDQRHHHDERFDHYRLDYPAGDAPAVDFRNRYYDKPADDRKGYAEARYFFRYVENDSVYGHVQPYYRFDYAYSSEQNPLYRDARLPTALHRRAELVVQHATHAHPSGRPPLPPQATPAPPRLAHAVGPPAPAPPAAAHGLRTRRRALPRRPR